MQSFFSFFFDCVFIKLYITPFCPETFAEVCSKESERNYVDGWCSSHTSVFGTPVLQVLLVNTFAVKNWQAFYLLCVFGVTVFSLEGHHIPSGANVSPGAKSFIERWQWE